jgi:hypothetical protein
LTTAYALLLDRCGLSQREAAAFHDVRLDTVKSWSSARNNPPAGVIEELRGLYARIARAAAEAVAAIGAGATPAEAVELGIAVDDQEAQSLGWPCVGAHAAVLGLVAAQCRLAVSIVPRGCTPATAAAADAHHPLTSS